jgi:hypothetical protein
MPIRMYIILIRMFFIRDIAIVDLLQQQKQFAMNKQFVNLQSNRWPEINDLIESCRRGDQRAQLQVYKLYYKPLYNLCLQIISEKSKAEDLMQESFLLAFENIHSYNGNLEFYSWLVNHIKYAYRYGKTAK